jgi:hypothetical protein
MSQYLLKKEEEHHAACKKPKVTPEDTSYGT